MKRIIALLLLMLTLISLCACKATQQEESETPVIEEKKFTMSQSVAEKEIDFAVYMKIKNYFNGSTIDNYRCNVLNAKLLDDCWMFTVECEFLDTDRDVSGTKKFFVYVYDGYAKAEAY